MKVKNSMFEGAFYPSNGNELREMVGKYLHIAEHNISNKEVHALIVPHAGYIYSGMTAGLGYGVLTKQQFKRAVLIGPSHSTYFTGIAFADYDYWQTPLGKIKLYQPSGEYSADFQRDEKLINKEHSVEVQLPFLQVVNPRAEAMIFVAGEITNHIKYAKLISTFLENDTVLIVSSDLSHYLEYEKAVSIDAQTIEKILLFDASLTAEQACGFEGINIMLEIAKLKHWQPKLLDYKNSGDTAGDKFRVVGYTAIAFTD